MLESVGAAGKLIERARASSLSPDLAGALERELGPELEAFLAIAPPLPPTEGAEETQLMSKLLQVFLPHAPLLLGAMPELVDAVSASLDDLLDERILDDRSKRRPLRHLEEALESLVRVGAAGAALMTHEPELVQLADSTNEPSELLEQPELRVYLRGLLCLLVALDRIEGDAQWLAPWAWMARRETLKSEGLLMVALRVLEPPAPLPLPRRVPGDWKGRVRIADDFDEPLPKDLEDSFYDPHL